MPDTMANMIGAEVVHHTRGGARLAEHLNPNTKMGARTQAAFQKEKWDYVILQEMSNGPITSKEKFLANVSKLCDQIRENGSTSVLYATWAYQKEGKQLEKFGMDYDENVLHSDQTYTIEVENKVDKHDTRLRIFYLYQLLLSQTDENHSLTTKQIMDKMQELHQIHMHQTTVPSDIALLQAAGFDIVGVRKRAWEYHLVDRTFSIPELKILIDAVQSSKFITEKKSKDLIERLISLASEK